MATACELGLSGVSGTLLVPLSARALARRLFPATDFSDPAAEAIVAGLGLDPLEIVLDPLSILGFITRSRIFDRVITAFVEAHPDGIVLDLGAGLSTAFERIPVKPAFWYDIDLPAVTELHARVVPSDPRRRLVAASIDTPGWLAKLEIPDGPVLVLAEGVLPYLTADAIATLFTELADRFSGRNAELVCDVFSFLMIGTARYHPAIGRLARADPTVEFVSGVRTRSDYSWGEARWRLDEINDVMTRLPPPVALWGGMVEATFGVPIYAIARLHLDAGAPAR